MSINTTASGEWWVDISVYESGYIPGSFSAGPFVEASHNMLAGLRNNNFDPSNSDYTYGLLTFVVLFRAVGILASMSWLFTYLRLAEREIFRFTTGIIAVVVMIIASLALLTFPDWACWWKRGVTGGVPFLQRGGLGTPVDSVERRECLPI